MPLDWPRINQFPEWYTLRPGNTYEVSMFKSGGSREHSEVYSGEELARGLPLKLAPGELLRVEVSELGTGRQNKGQ